MIYYKRKSTHSKVDAPEKVKVSSYEESLFCWPTGEAFLFFPTISLIKKVQKRYNQTTKGTEQSQYTDENRNDFESCHNNAPPFLYSSKLVNWLGRLPPCHGYSFTCYHAIILYHYGRGLTIQNRTSVRKIFPIFFASKVRLQQYHP